VRRDWITYIALSSPGGLLVLGVSARELARLLRDANTERIIARTSKPPHLGLSESAIRSTRNGRPLLALTAEHKRGDSASSCNRKGSGL
jgi:hypothetical protein